MKSCTMLLSLLLTYPNRRYLIRTAPDQTAIASMSGKELMEKGFPVKTDQPYDSRLYEWK